MNGIVLEDLLSHVRRPKYQIRQGSRSVRCVYPCMICKQGSAHRHYWYFKAVLRKASQLLERLPNVEARPWCCLDMIYRLASTYVVKCPSYLPLLQIIQSILFQTIFLIAKFSNYLGTFSLHG